MHVHTHTPHIKEDYSVLKREFCHCDNIMNLEDIILGERSQTQKDKCGMVSLIWGI